MYKKNKSAGLLLTAMSAAILLSGCVSKKPVETNSAETVETSQNETLAESNAQPGEQKITDKNLKSEDPFVFVIERENIDDFWNSYLPEVTIQNEWIHAADAGYSIAVFGALKDDPEQGTVNMVDVDPDNRITGSRQILAPSKGGSLSVTDEETAKEFIMEAEDEHGTTYLFDYYNGFTAFKEGKGGDWEYRIKDGDSYEKLIAAAGEYIIKHDDKIRMDYDFSTAFMSTGTDEIPGYLIEDIDGDGIDELIFGENGNNPDDKGDDMWDGIVYEIYTTYNRMPVRVLKGWERSRYYFCENGMLAHEGSSGAGNSSYSYFTYGESKLNLVEAVIYDGLKDADHPWFYSTESEYDTENAEPISEERMVEIRSRYVYEHPVFIPFAEDK